MANCTKPVSIFQAVQIVRNKEETSVLFSDFKDFIIDLKIERKLWYFSKLSFYFKLYWMNNVLSFIVEAKIPLALGSIIVLRLFKYFNQVMIETAKGQIPQQYHNHAQN